MRTIKKLHIKVFDVRKSTLCGATRTLVTGFVLGSIYPNLESMQQWIERNKDIGSYYICKECIKEFPLHALSLTNL